VRFNNIQILRFVAAFGVLLFHAHTYVGEIVWKTGLTRFFDYHFSWGVQLFFVISGFVVSHSLASMPPGRFFAYRVIRIYPALWLASAILVLWRLLVLDVQPDWATLAASLTLVPNGGNNYYVLGGLEWTLVYEMFFYTLLAAVASLRWANAREWAMLVWLALIGGAALWDANVTVGTPSLAAIVFSAFNLPFIAGALGYAWFTRAPRLPIAWLALTVPVALYAAHRTPSTVVALAMHAIGFGALVLVAAQASRWRDAASTNLFVKLGDCSYGLYLVHLSIVLGVATLFKDRPTDSHLAFALALAAGLAGGVAYGMLELRVYHRAKAVLARRWQLRPPPAGVASSTAP
jgi:peptidoglycan/LPS O-acetylase OafA/YrhL